MELGSQEASAAARPSIDNRASPRFDAAQVPSITSLRLSPHGADATLINISGTGLLAECNIRLKTGGVVTVSFVGSFEPSSVAGRVVRCMVATMNRQGGIQYHVAIAFDEPIAFKTAPEEESTDPAAVSAAGSAPAPIAAAPEPTPVRPPVRNRW